MKKILYTLFSLLLLASMVLVGCGPIASEGISKTCTDGVIPVPIPGDDFVGIGYSATELTINGEKSIRVIRRINEVGELSRFTLPEDALDTIEVMLQAGGVEIPIDFENCPGQASVTTIWGFPGYGKLYGLAISPNGSALEYIEGGDPDSSDGSIAVYVQARTTPGFWGQGWCGTVGWTYAKRGDPCSYAIIDKSVLVE